MVNKIILLNRRYCPGEAWTNRVLAYAKGFSEEGIDVELHYLISDRNRTEYEINIPGVKVIDYWKDDRWIAKNNRLFSFIINLFKIKNKIGKGECVFISENAFFIMLASILNGCDVYCEFTEHPDIYTNRIIKFFVRLSLCLLKYVKGVIVISNSLRSYFAENGVVDSKLMVSNMFVDSSRFNGIAKKSTVQYIGYCGTISIQKDGVDDLITAFSIFYKSHPCYSLHIAGPGQNANVIPCLKEQCMQLGIADNVFFLGKVSPEDMPAFLQDATILALARPDSLQAKNGFPTKLGEYLATGNPVVVTRVGEIPLYIKDKENGYLVEPGNPFEFAKTLEYVADNLDDARRVGCNGISLVKNEFSYLVQSRKVIDFINAHNRIQ